MLCVVCTCLMLCSCQRGRSPAVKAYDAALSARKETQTKSVLLYEAGMKARSESKAEEAIRYMREAVEVDPQHAQAWMVLGVLEYKRKNVFEAARAFHRAGRIAPTRYEPHFNLGTIFEAVGYYEQAIEEYEIALKLSPNEVEVMENLARCYFHNDTNLEKARKLARGALRHELRPEWKHWLEMRTYKTSSTDDESNRSINDSAQKGTLRNDNRKTEK